MRFRPATLFMFLAFVLVLSPVGAQAQYSAFDDPPAAGGPGAASGSFQEISPAKPEMDGGDIAAGQTSQIVLLLRNNTGAPIKMDRIELAPSSNITAKITTNPCADAPMQPNLECAVTFGVKGETPGKYRLGLLIYHNGKTQLSNAAIIGTVGAGKTGAATGLPANEIEAFPANLDFGTAKGRTPLVRSIALRNASGNTVKIRGIELAASPLTGYSVSAGDCKELKASQACVATVTWAPQAEGSAQGVLVLRHDGPAGGLQIPLKGEYQIAKTEAAKLFPDAIPGQGLVVADRDKVDFGTSVDGAASITASLVNNGDTKVTLRQVKLAGSDNGLTMSNDGCATGKVLEPFQGCALTVNWSPRRAGPVIDDIQIIHDGARGVLILPVRGTATKEASTSTAPGLSAVSTLPKISVDDLDKSIVGDAVGAKASGTAYDMNNAMAMPAGGDASTLNGYRVTSMSGDRAILAGPRGRILVRNGVRQLIAGGYWKPEIGREGIKLVGEKDAVLLFFDRTMTIGKDGDTEEIKFPETPKVSTTSSTTSSSSSGSGFGGVSSSSNGGGSGTNIQ